ncbi:MAG: MFS transporter [Acidobacteriota bacterium]
MTEALRARMRTFYTVWTGQVVSMVGTGLTSFALGVWVYQKTGSATSFALIFLFMELPGILISPLAGALVDRYDRRLVMIFSDLVAGLASAIVLVLALMGSLEVWHIYLVVAIGSVGNAFQLPAYLATLPLMVPEERLGQANGLTQTAQAIRQVLAPAMAGFLLLEIGIQGVVAIDVVTFLVALVTLMMVRFPRPEPAEGEIPGGMKGELTFGLAYIFRHPGLLAILLVIAWFSFILSIIGPLITPMILEFTTPAVLGILTSIGGVGMLFGGFAMSSWGGPERRIHGVLGFLMLSGIALMAHGLAPSSVLIGICAFFFFGTLPFVFACNDIIWQTKVAPEVLGKVLAARQMLTRLTAPVGYFVAGPLADHVFEPMLEEGGSLSASVGQVIGVGAGRGIAFMFILGGASVLLVAAIGYLVPSLRRVEDEPPGAGA